MHAFNLNEAVPLLCDDVADMVVRGAYLDYSVRLLEQSRLAHASRVELAQASHAPFLNVKSGSTQAPVEDVALVPLADLALTDRALSASKWLSERLRTRCETALEAWLTVHCDEYRRAVEAKSDADNWEQALHRVEVDAHHFILTLSTVRNLAPAGYDPAAGGFSQATLDAIGQARVDAAKVDAGITMTNEIAERHDALLGQTAFDVPMPRVVQVPHLAEVEQLVFLPVAAAQAECRRVIGAVENLIDQEIDALRNRVHASAHEHHARMKRYVRDAWNQLHAYAAAHSVEPDQVAEVVAQTEKLYAATSATRTF